MRTGENIFKRKDGRWEARYHKGRSASGGILYGYCYGKTYTEAKQNVEYAKRNFENTETHNAVPEQKPMHWYCDSWLQTNRLRLRDSTYIKYRGFLDHHINPFFGNLLPAEISSQTVSAFSDLLLETKGLSLKTVRDILSALNTIFHYITKHFPDLMGVVDVVYPAAAWSEIRVLTVEEQQILTTYLLEDMNLCKFGILLALLTGIRIGELCALRWDHVLLDSKLLRVDASMQRLKNLSPDAGSKTAVVIGSPKSQSSIRSIPMPDYLVDLCHKLRPSDPKAFVLTGTAASYMEPRTVQRKFAKYAEDCGLENVTVHTCRHTFATRCIEAGFEIKSLSEIMGHANVSVTMNRYVHCSMNLKRENMEKVQWPGIG